MYRILGRTKKEVVGRWSLAQAEVKAILRGAEASVEKSTGLVRRMDHRATILHLVEQEYVKEAAQRFEVGDLDDKTEHTLMDRADRLEGFYPKEKLALLCTAPSFQNALQASQMSWIGTLSSRPRGTMLDTTGSGSGLQSAKLTCK